MVQKQAIEAAFKNFAQGLKQSFQLKGIFFDMDGVLFNSMPLHATAWIEAFGIYDIHLHEVEPFMNEGSTASYTVEKMFRKYLKKDPTPEITEKIRQHKHHIMAELPAAEIMQPMPDLLKLIDRQKLDCWVVTGSAQELLLDRLEKEYGGTLKRRKMVTAHDVKIGKPHPEPYLIGMKKSGMGTSEAIVIENAPLGIQSAKAAGLFTIAINTGPLAPKVLEEAGADLVLSGSHELLQTWPSIYSLLLNKQHI